MSLRCWDWLLCIKWVHLNIGSWAKLNNFLPGSFKLKKKGVEGEKKSAIERPSTFCLLLELIANIEQDRQLLLFSLKDVNICKFGLTCVEVDQFPPSTGVYWVCYCWSASKSLHAPSMPGASPQPLMLPAAPPLSTLSLSIYLARAPSVLMFPPFSFSAIRPATHLVWFPM